ncbi:hypothetical protein CSOJ01_10711 [Colletotrichum sojae]|uniref:Uncharacterized protein n=1 Tax=Colletotrichum sojae TaxID=2175907 RepID=A0A8H6MPP4_9PEZI|nr:hypothetical protein CSOJ01_10711 [Colletotrichum sojae]
MAVRTISLLAVVLVLASLPVTSADEALPALPPADPTSQDPDPCAYENHWEMIERLGQLPGYNDSISSLLVERCRNVCQLLHGSGNPDVTGIGAMISYRIQGFLVFLSGPAALRLLREFGAELSWTDRRRRNEPTSIGMRSILSLMESVHSTSIFFALPLMVSAAVRLWNWKDMPLVEIDILYHLVTYELLLCVVGLMFYFHLAPIRWSARQVLAVIFAWCSVLLQISVCIADWSIDRRWRVVGFILWLGDVAYHVSWIERTVFSNIRNSRKSTEVSSGEEYEENQWGFGQITIMMMWLPLVQDAIVIGWEYYKDRRRQYGNDASSGSNVTAQAETSSTTTGSSHAEASGIRQRVNNAETENIQPHILPARTRTLAHIPWNFWEAAERLGQSANDAAAMSDLLVQKCRNVCILLYGSGNPDTTGIGVMICYHIQGILVFLAGPLLRNILAVRGRDVFRRVRAGENSNLLAATPAPSTRLRRAFTILRGLLVVFHAGLEVAESIGTGSAGGSADLVNGLLNSCTSRHGFPDLETTFSSTSPWISGTAWAQFAMYSYPPLSFMWIWQMVYKEELSEDAAAANATWLSAPLTKLSAALAVPIYHPALVESEERFPLLLGQTVLRVELLRKKSFKRRDRIARFLLGVCSLGEAAIHMLWLDYLTLGRIRAVRRDMQEAVGEEYDENRWGFGQVTIMMMWLPIKSKGPWWRDRAQHGDGREASTELQDVPPSRASDDSSQTEQEATSSSSATRQGLTARTTFDLPTKDLESLDPEVNKDKSSVRAQAAPLHPNSTSDRSRACGAQPPPPPPPAMPEIDTQGGFSETCTLRWPLGVGTPHP